MNSDDITAADLETEADARMAKNLQILIRDWDVTIEAHVNTVTITLSNKSTSRKHYFVAPTLRAAVAQAYGG